MTTIGDFLAYQYVTDLNYSTLLNFSETELVVPGPGTVSGLQKCFADTDGLTDAEVIRLVQDWQSECFAAVDITFPSLWGREWQLIDGQNLFCEVDKYARVADPQFAAWMVATVSKSASSRQRRCGHCVIRPSGELTACSTRRWAEARSRPRSIAVELRVTNSSRLAVLAR